MTLLANELIISRVTISDYYYILFLTVQFKRHTTCFIISAISLV